ncbi:MAG: hypothetical protein JWQ87_2325 [Candidatus Sulfotelmatobacter sp.]|nr:hypothetical protein [Candidatus Sulfotelmatobacter sp.]
MFDRTLNSSWDERSRRGLTTLTSFGLQALALTVLLVLPLLRPQGLPLFRQLATPVSWGQPLAAPIRSTTRAGASTTGPDTLSVITLRTPPRIPNGIAATENDAPPQIGASGPGIPGVGSGDPNGVRNLFVSGSRPILPTAQPPRTAAPVRISNRAREV